MSKKVTLQDIADALGLSRNTVSKAFNGKHLPEKTRTRIINKAIEMGYKELDKISNKHALLKNKRILLLTTKDLQQLNFFIDVIRGIEDLVNKYDLLLFQYYCKGIEEFEELKTYIETNQIDGILCIEVFDSAFINKLLSLELSVVFIDFVVDDQDIHGQYDVIMMENINAVKHLLIHLIKKHKMNKLGFVGDYNHCRGFYERFIGYKEALFSTGLPYVNAYNITKADDFPYGDSHSLSQEIQALKELPDCFVCANDFIAVSLINALSQLGIHVPKDIQVVGFDNSKEAKISNPPLTSIDVDKEELGREALIALLNRIKYQDHNNKYIYIKTAPIIRQSTKN